MELDHVQIAIPAGSEEACDAFYVDLLDCVVLEKPRELAGRGGRWYRVGSHQIHLGVDPNFVPATKAHVALRSHSYDEFLNRLVDAGVAVTPDNTVPHLTRCYVTDPVGNRVEILKA